MAEKLKIISLGGLDEIGKNMTVYEYGNDIIVVDCGMGFPDDDMYGIDVVIPDVSYLIKNQSKIRGIFITHGHEDHIGALPYVLRSINAPMFKMISCSVTPGWIWLMMNENARSVMICALRRASCSSFVLMARIASIASERRLSASTCVFSVPAKR